MLRGVSGRIRSLCTAAAAVIAAAVFSSCFAAEKNDGTVIVPKNDREDKEQPSVQTEVVVDTPSYESGGEGLPAAAADYFLSDEDGSVRKCFKQIYSGLMDYRKEIDITDGVLDSKSAGDMIAMLTASAPDISRLMNEYSLSLDKDGYVSSVKVGYEKDKQQSDDQYRLVRDEAEAVCSRAEGLTDYEKVKYFHDALVSRCSYTYEGDNVYSAYGCLVEGNAVCEGYSKAFLLLCQLADIQCIPIIGTSVTDGEEEPHMWNKVMLDGNWYNVDVTWDDPISDLGDDYVRYDYFCVSDKDMAADHIPGENRFMNYPTADDKSMDYFAVNGLLAENTAQAEDMVKRETLSAVRNGSRYVRIKCSDAAAFDNVCEALFGNADGGGSIFSILSDVADATDGAVSSGAYSVIKNQQTFTITVILALL